MAKPFRSRVRVLLSASALLALLAALVPTPVGAQEATPPPTCGGKEATIVGTSGNDVLIGTNGNDVIVGLGGRDKIRGLDGNDTICGGPGGDVLVGGAGRDVMFGETGRDKLIGGTGRDALNGGNAADFLNGGGGPDWIASKGGDDFVLGGAGVDRCKIDRNDVFVECEGGDIRGASGFGSAVVELDVPASFALNTFEHLGETVSMYVVEISIGTFDGEPAAATIVSTDGQPLGFFFDDSGSYFGRVQVIGEPGSIEIDSPSGFYAVSVLAPKLIQQLERDYIAVGIDDGNRDRVMMIEPAISGGNGAAFLEIVGGTPGSAITMWTMSPGLAPLISHQAVLPVNEPFLRIALPPGTRYAGVQTSGVAEWELYFTD